MSKLGVVEDTLFVPMLGRIYASEHCPQILYDQKALELKKKLPSALLEQDKQGQYTLIASAARSANMDRIIRAFLECRPDGVIVQLGCGLETAYYRCDRRELIDAALELEKMGLAPINWLSSRSDGERVYYSLGRLPDYYRWTGRQTKPTANAEELQ